MQQIELEFKMSHKFTIKTYELNVLGFPTITRTCRRRGKMIAREFYDYQHKIDNDCTFKEFLGLCRVLRVRNLHQKKVWVDGVEVTQVGPEQGSSIPIMRDGDDTPVWSHVSDVSNQRPIL